MNIKTNTMKEQIKQMKIIDTERRKIKGLSIKDLCHMQGITNVTYHNAINGNNRIAYEDVIGLSQFLNIKSIEI